MKALILLLIGIVVGAFCTLAATNALGKRNAHGRAVMVALARHVDAVRELDPSPACNNTQADHHLEQIAAAARDIDFAFPGYKDDRAFQRRSAHFRSLAENAAAAPCELRTSAIAAVARDCQECHRQFR